MNRNWIIAVGILTSVLGLLVYTRILTLSNLNICRLTTPLPNKVNKYTSLLSDNCSADSVLCGLGRDNEPVRALLNSMSVEILKHQFHQYMTTGNFSLCTERKRFGKAGDGGYEVCMSSPFQPTPRKCLVYSFGISTDWSFDAAMKAHGCEVHSFDPSIGLPDHIHPPGIHFHNLGLWGSDMVNEKKWSLAKLSTIRRKLGHETRVIDYLKVDVEAAEWPFLRNIVTEEPEQLATVRQLALELHTPLVNPRRLTRDDLVEMIHYVSRLGDLGLTVVHNRQHNGCCGRFAPLMPPGIPEKCCHETFYVNTRFIGPSN